jgi:isochorismate hydrolase
MTVSSQDNDATRTAFLALDFAAYIVENFSHDDGVASRAAAALAAARRAGLPVIHVVPDGMQDQIHPLMAPAADEPVLGKSSIGAFATTSLDPLLRQSGVGQLIVAGVATSGTVLSTTRWAVDTGTGSPSAPTPALTPTRARTPRWSTRASSRRAGSDCGASPGCCPWTPCSTSSRPVPSQRRRPS